MGSMTDERRKEMEEEMMRFEQEIAIPGDDEDEEGMAHTAKPASKASIANKKSLQNRKLSPPPPPPNMAAIFPKVLKPPPPPPVHIIQQERLHPPHIVHGPQPPPQIARMQFIPHQIQRQPPRLPRPNMMPMRMPHGFPGPGPLPFPPLQGALPPPMHLPMPPMGMHMPMPPGFCPPPPGITLAQMPPQPFMPHMSMTYDDNVALPPKQEQPPVKLSEPETTTDNTTSTTIATTTTGSVSVGHSTATSAPVMYTALPKKSFVEKSVESMVTNGSSVTSVVMSSSCYTVNEEVKLTKTEDTVNSSAVQTGDTGASKKEKKKKKIVRMAGGQAWEDNSLMDWDSDDFRIFCGDLGNDVTDEVLIRAFSKFPSFGKAKVIRDKRTNKTKGYGFVSFKDPQDFIRAMREMNGRYVGSRPIKLRKSTWRDRNIDLVRKKQKEKERLGLL